VALLWRQERPEASALRVALLLPQEDVQVELLPRQAGLPASQPEAASPRAAQPAWPLEA
jgi:hypothetical protein